MQSFADRDGFIWYNGQLVPWRNATTHALTYALHYGVGCFEGIRAYDTKNGPAVFRLVEHTRRLLNSAKILGMQLPYSEEHLNDAVLQVLRANELRSAYIRPLAYYGPEGVGLRTEPLKVHVLIAAWTQPPYLGEENLARGIRVKTSTFAKYSPNAAMCRAKASGHYINSMLALNEVVRDGYEEALVLDSEGYVAEGSAENIFIVQKGELVTPELTSALDGITRDTVIHLAKGMGLRVHEARLTRDAVYIADEAFFTGTAAEVVPIREVDNRVVGNGTRGPITKLLQAAYQEAVTGTASPSAQWLVPVGSLR